MHQRPTIFLNNLIFVLGDSHNDEEIESMISINDNLKKELENIISIIESQYTRMKEEKKK